MTLLHFPDPLSSYLGREVRREFELFQVGGDSERSEEKDDREEENVGNVVAPQARQVTSVPERQRVFYAIEEVSPPKLSYWSHS